MAENFLVPVINKLFDLLTEEVKLSKRVLKQVKSLQKELEFIQPLLKHAEAKLENGETRDVMQVWLKQVREEANRIEEIIAEYLYFVEAKQNHLESGCSSCFSKVCGFVKDLKQRHDIALKIRDVKDSLREIKDRGQGYGLRPLEQGSSSTTANAEAPVDPRLGSLFIDKDELVGIERESEEIIRKLVEGSPTRLVISLVGQGGIGKTTLAKKVYDDDLVKGHFELYAWITVSQSYSLKKLLMNMKKQICTSERGMEGIDNEAEQIQDLRNILEAKRYLVVFDDVWKQEFWGVIKSALPNNNKGSRILITTRNVVVANSSPCDLVQLQTWCPSLAWELFCKKAFQSEFQGRCPQDLEHLSREIVNKCQGLPLAIATVAGLLSTKEKVELEWRRLLDDLASESEMNSQLNSILQILSLSYYDLPSPLKSCFLYFGIFPEDYSISDERLYRLWIAEGFIKARREMTLEEVAEAYLNELIQRNLVTSSQSLSFGEGKFYGVHDLMHDVILSRSNEVCFSQTFDGNESRFRGAGRRLRMSGSIDNVLKIVGDSTIRSVFFSNIDDQLTKSFFVTLFKKFKFLEVMDFERVPLNTLPKEVGNLFQLKYLSLRYTKVKILPKSIRNLHKLQSLDIRETLIREIPVEINELRNLRHLLAYTLNESSFDYLDGVKMHEGLEILEELQTLTLLEAHHGRVGLVKELEKLRKLRWLEVSKLTSETWRGVCASIQNMDHLQRLGLFANDENEVLDLQYISSPPRFLQDLILIGQLQNLPDTISKFRNLRGLYLSFSWLIDDPCKWLKQLSSLEILKLVRGAFVGEELHFEKGGFEKLKDLRLGELDGLKHIEIDEGALPALEILLLKKCPLMKEAPSVKHLRMLKHFEIDERRIWN
ncbi:hypothetical protein UlMin_041950 [Ulmus minor]